MVTSYDDRRGGDRVGDEAMTITVDRRPDPWMVGARLEVHAASVAQRSAHAENLFVVRWGSPEALDTEEIKRIVPTVHRAAGKDLVYLAIMPADLPNLDDGQRKLLMDLTETVLPYCAFLIIVMEARGFRGAILRSAMTAVTLLTRKHETLRVVDSIEAGLEVAKDKLPEDRHLVERTIVDVGGRLGEVA